MCCASTLAMLPGNCSWGCSLMRQPGLFDDPATESQQTNRIAFRPDYEGFRAAAKHALKAELLPALVWWVEEPGADLHESVNAGVDVPREFARLARFVSCHRSPDRWSLLYQVLWRLTHGEPHLLSLGGDPIVARMHRYDKSVHRDFHKMKAFVRFKQVNDSGEERFVAWFEPEHYVIGLVARFFSRRFTNMRWSLLTPMGCAHWEGSGKPLITEGLNRAHMATDELDQMWKIYYRNIFNPARVKTDAMRAEMPQKYWKHLPEAATISDLLIHADERVDRMITAETPAPSLRCGERPASYSQLLEEKIISSDARLDQIAAGVRACENCALSQAATQAVPGEGPPDARVMIVGEQPGDHEDLEGRPFVGPAGQLLDEVLQEIDVDRGAVYLTNAVKHFKFRATPVRRLHEKPREGEVHACRHWLQNEIDAVKPELIICLGVTAASAVTGRPVKLRDLLGHIYDLGDYRLLATLHPAAVLRSGNREAARHQLGSDLRLAFESLSS